MVASVRSGRRTGSPKPLSTLNACGEVTSWMRCKSMYSTAGVSAVSATTSCAAQTLSNRVRMRRSGFSGFQPGHARAQLGADFFDGVRQIRLQQLGVLAPPALVLRYPLAREFALLDLGQNLAHFLLGGLVDDARPAGQIAVLRRLA